MCYDPNGTVMSPLADWLADKLGVERRKYLVRGRQTYQYMTDDDMDNKRFGFVNDIINYQSCGFFELVGDVSKDFIVTEDGVGLCELKYKQTQPIHRTHIRDENSYRELFIGDTFDYIAEPLAEEYILKDLHEPTLKQLAYRRKCQQSGNVDNISLELTLANRSILAQAHSTN